MSALGYALGYALAHHRQHDADTRVQPHTPFATPEGDWAFCALCREHRALGSNHPAYVWRTYLCPPCLDREGLEKSSTRPRLLDLFCGAGGCSVGYHRAGFDPVGVDVDRLALRRYPFPAVHMDAMDALAGGIDLDKFDAVHASPPCQPYSITRHTHSNRHPDLLGLTLDLLTAWGDNTGGAWVVENVPGAPMPPDLTVVICGADHEAHDPETGLTLRLKRHRLFASNRPLLSNGCRCDSRPVGGVYGGGSSDRNHAREVRRGGYTPAQPVRRALMGIDWMTQQQLSQAIPPTYTEHIGWQLLNVEEAAS